jgi:hypothetical protein
MNLKSVFFSLLALIIAVSCGSKKVPAQKGSTEIVLPITNFTSDKNYLRTIANGKSPNMSFAKELAYKNAANELAKNIETRVKTLLEDYARQAEIDSQVDYKAETERMVTVSANQSLKNAVIAKEKIFQNEDNTYQYWLGVEISKEDVFKAVQSSISSSKLKALHTDKVEFRETFDRNFDEK